MTGVFAWPKKCIAINEGTFCRSAISGISGIDDVVEIGAIAFRNTTNMTGIFNWPPKCSIIKPGTFYESAISGISGIECVKEIGKYAFAGTPNLSGEFLWPENCAVINEGTFLGSAITGISGIDKVTEIGYLAFANSALNNIVVGERLNSISLYAFAEKSKPTSKVHMDFAACEKLTINTNPHHSIEGLRDILHTFFKDAHFPFDAEIEVK